MNLSLIIPTLGRTDRLRQTLESLSHCDPQPHEVIVIDGEDSDDTRDVVERYPADLGVRVLYTRSVPGSSHQRNEGMRVATGDVAVFVDDDISFDLTPDVFAQLGDLYRDERVVGVTGQIIQADVRPFGGASSRVRRVLLGGETQGRFTDFGYPRYLQEPKDETDVEYMHGCFMSARLPLALEIGFDEALTGYALCEDEDFSYRLSRRGAIKFVPSIVIRHDQFGKRNVRLKDHILVANRTYLFRKNFRQTPVARIKFAAFIAMLVGHRLVNREFDGARGLLEGIGDAVRGRVPYAGSAAKPSVPYASDAPPAASQDGVPEPERRGQRL